MSAARQYLLEVQAYDTGASALKTLRFASRGYASAAADTPAHQFFEGRILQPLLMRRDCFSPGRTSGRASMDAGVVELDNTDGALDYLADWALQGRTLVQRIGQRGAVYPSGYATVLTGTVFGVEVTRQRARIKVRDKASDIAEKPAAPSQFAGDNVLPAGVEGVAGDLKGKRKLMVWGVCENVPLPCVNTSRFIYLAANTDAAVDAVYDRAIALTAGGTYASQAALLDDAQAPAAGQYKVWRSGAATYIRCGTKPTGQLTADLTEGASAGDRTVAQVFKRVLLGPAGLSAGEISSVDLTALDTATSSAVAGVAALGDETIGAVLDLLTAPLGIWWGVDALGVLRIGQWLAPAGSPAITLREGQFRRFERVNPGDRGDGMPVKAVHVDYRRAWYVQSDGFDSNITAARLAFVRQQYRRASVDNGGVLTAWPVAPEWTVATLLRDESAALAEANRQKALRGVGRSFYEAEVFFRNDDLAGVLALFASVDLGTVIQVVHRRFGCASGKLLRVAGLRPDLARGRLELSLWG